MKNKKAVILFFFISFLIVNSTYTAEKKSSKDKEINDLINSGASEIKLTIEEKKLYDLIMNYRKSRGLKEIPLSKSLTLVAKIHVRDLNTHTFSKECNIHSWSNDGQWTGGGYTPDHKNAKFMWDKPRELTAYKGDGFEMASGYSSSQGYSITAETALSLLKQSSGHNNVIINLDVWKNIE